MTKLATIPTKSHGLDDRALGRQLVDQFDKASAGMMEYIAFGALVLHVQERVEETAKIEDTATRGPSAKGTGLKAWLKEFAPKIPDSTAYRFAELADGIKAEFKLGAKIDLYEVLKAAKPNDAQKKLRLKISGFVDGKSQRQLLIGFGKFEAKQGGARVTTKKVSEAERRAAWLTLAKTTAEETLTGMHELGDRWQLVADDKLRLAISQAEAFAARAAKWLKTPAPQRAAFDLDSYIKSEEQK